MSQKINPVTEADKAWKNAFVKGPYTGFVMLDYLRAKANLQWTKVLQDGPKKSLKPVTQAMVVADKTPAMANTWAGKTGRCTSFAVNVTYMLERTYPGVYDFQIYDLGRHRVARCQKTGILIDSSSAKGAFVLPEGEWVRLEGSEGSWKWIKGKSKFERQEGTGVKSSSVIIDKQTAMATCLLELPGASSIPTLFRSVDRAGNAAFHGMVVWVWKSKRLELLPTLASRTHKMVIQFAPQGTDQTNEMCINNLMQFVKQYGGPYGPAQWDTVELVNMEMWSAACAAWGKPVWSEEGKAA